MRSGDLSGHFVQPLSWLMFSLPYFNDSIRSYKFNENVHLHYLVLFQSLFEPDDSPSYNSENIALLFHVPRHLIGSYYKNFRVYFVYSGIHSWCFTYPMSNFKWPYSLQQDGYGSEDSLDVENTLWANCVVASGSALGVVVYTGSETRSVMNNSQPRSKVGLLDLEINQLTKVWGYPCNIQLWYANV